MSVIWMEFKCLCKASSSPVDSGDAISDDCAVCPALCEVL